MALKDDYSTQIPPKRMQSTAQVCRYKIRKNDGSPRKLRYYKSAKVFTRSLFIVQSGDKSEVFYLNACTLIAHVRARVHSRKDYTLDEQGVDYTHLFHHVVN